MEAADILAQSIDKSQVPPLHQKRILAFVNHFLISSCAFLNDFATKCESKFIELERKMQKVEAALTIIEAKLASIPDSDVNEAIAEAASTALPAPPPTPATQQEERLDAAVEAEAPRTVSENSRPTELPESESGVLACDDVRYKKFFKMVQVGVPANAVKIKMQAEGVESSILDTPNLLLADGTAS